MKYLIDKYSNGNDLKEKYKVLNKINEK